MLSRIPKASQHEEALQKEDHDPAERFDLRLHLHWNQRQAFVIFALCLEVEEVNVAIVAPLDDTHRYELQQVANEVRDGVDTHASFGDDGHVLRGQ